ncbi:hypothetical protein QBC32DRAFT_76513 [Pseudoneurospora amorphoporcata]|uniref:Uncharacterized protein n=1 Tax=Pseudoneurospora amorphoporcata TaxID=241081 RepID=A0AAN6NYY1_9PEZI|nr:hypothetical protein QBC32DRAFT_76513 [Pseudoneurospora amorphoporcata]
MAYRTSADRINGYSHQEYRYNDFDDDHASSSFEDSTPRSSSHHYYDTDSVADSANSSYAPSTAYSMRSASTAITVPPRGLDRPTLEQQLNQGPQGPHNQGGDLWCELRVVAGCGATFHLNEESAWINHHLMHLNNTLPSTVVCWFCDDYPFSVNERAPPADRQRNFVDRMRHIHGHIQEDESLTIESMRPDFNMADHMYQSRLIDEHMWRAYKSYTEVPPPMRIPGTPGSVSYNRHQHGQSQRGPHGPLTPPQDDGWYRSPEELEDEERRYRRRMERSRR